MAIIDGQLKQSERRLVETVAEQLGFVAREAVNEVIQGILEGNKLGLNEAAIQQQLMAKLI